MAQTTLSVRRNDNDVLERDERRSTPWKASSAGTILSLTLSVLSVSYCRGADEEPAPKAQGRLIWRCKSDAKVGPLWHDMNPYTNLPYVQFEPLIHGDEVFWAIGFRRNLTVCATDLASGKPAFRVKIEIGGNMFHGMAPVADALWIRTDNKAVQLDRNSGKVGRELPPPPSMGVGEHEPRYFASGDVLAAINAAINGDEEALARQSEAAQVAACTFQSLTHDKDHVYFVDQTRSAVIALDRRTGEEKWSTRLRYSTRGVAADGSHLFATSHIDPANTNQTCDLHKLSGPDGKEVGKVALPAKRRARNAAFQPHVDDSYVYVVQPASFSVFSKDDLKVVFRHDHERAADSHVFGCSYVARPVPFGKDILLTVRHCTLRLNTGTGLHGGDSTVYYLFSPTEQRFTARSASVRGAPLSAPSIRGERIYQTTEEGELLCYEFGAAKKSPVAPEAKE